MGKAKAVRAPVSRERVVLTAVDLADREGIEALTMRRLGQELGVEAMSVYNHVANKGELLGLMIDRVVAEFELPGDGTDWKNTIRTSSVSAHGSLVRHPWACQLMLTYNGFPMAARLRYMDSLLGTLRRAGFSAEMTHYAYHTLDFYILGFALQEVSFPFDEEELQEVGATFLRDLSTDDHPHLAEHVMGHLRSEFGGSGFEFGLDLILDSLQRMRKR